MKIKLLVLCFSLLSGIAANAQTKVFPDLDFANKKYQLYIFEGNQTIAVDRDGNVIDAGKRYIIDDQEKIKELANNWVGESTSSMYMCGYDFDIYVIADNEIESIIRYNSECKQAVFGGKVVNVESNPFVDADKNNTFSSWRHTFTSKEKACRVFDEIIALDSLFIPHRGGYEWRDYGGRFSLTITDIKKEKERYNNSQIDIHWDMIREKYPDDKYSFRNGYTNINDYRDKYTKYEYHCYINSDKDFFDKFDMGEMYEKYGWKEYDLFHIFVFGTEDKINQLKSINSSENID